MSEAQNPDFVGDPDDLYESEDQETLDAIDRGIRDAEAGRFVPSEEARRIVAKWISEFSAGKRPSRIE